jgi:voltage-gated potassium channel
MNQLNKRQKLHHVIFGTDTPAGKTFDMVLIYTILASVATVILESVQSISMHYQGIFDSAEWFFTILFSVEYIIRIYTHPSPRKYIFSVYGFIDLVAILPTYLALIFTGAESLIILRLIRVMRIFRVLKLIEYVYEANTLWRSLIASRRKILVFFCFVFVLATIFGALMFLVEGPYNDAFSSIPTSIYWTIVTISTVGFGDIVPQTAFGQVVATVVILTGYSIIAVPTGIITSQLIDQIRADRMLLLCDNCGDGEHDRSAKFCKTCGNYFDREDEPEL